MTCTSPSRIIARLRAATAAALAVATLLAFPVAALSAPVCTILADAKSGRVLHEEGDCKTPVTPASTFKVPLAVMGYDSGLLIDANTPVMTFEPGDADWGGEAWTGDVGPAHWMRHSVLWYSQRLARSLGRERLAGYAQALRYGNADFSGDAGKDNGLARAWISSSLKISPRAQVAFIAALATGRLAVSQKAQALARAIVESSDMPDGWTVAGKTGSAFPRKADGNFDRARPWGWYVGWASKGERVIAFAYLHQDRKRTQGWSGMRARDQFLARWPALSSSLD
jgi:beta-lactamase class D